MVRPTLGLVRSPGLVGPRVLSDLPPAVRGLSGLGQTSQRLADLLRLVGPPRGLVRPPGLVGPPQGLVRPPERWASHPVRPPPHVDPPQAGGASHRPIRPSGACQASQRQWASRLAGLGPEPPSGQCQTSAAVRPPAALVRPGLGPGLSRLGQTSFQTWSRAPQSGQASPAWSELTGWSVSSGHGPVDVRAGRTTQAWSGLPGLVRTPRHGRSLTAGLDAISRLGRPRQGLVTSSAWAFQGLAGQTSPGQCRSARQWALLGLVRPPCSLVRLCRAWSVSPWLGPAFSGLGQPPTTWSDLIGLVGASPAWFDLIRAWSDFPGLVRPRPAVSLIGFSQGFSPGGSTSPGLGRPYGLGRASLGLVGLRWQADLCGLGDLIRLVHLSAAVRHYPRLCQASWGCVRPHTSFVDNLQGLFRPPEAWWSASWASPTVRASYGLCQATSGLVQTSQAGQASWDFIRFLRHGQELQAWLDLIGFGQDSRLGQTTSGLVRAPHDLVRSPQGIVSWSTGLVRPPRQWSLRGGLVRPYRAWSGLPRLDPASLGLVSLPGLVRPPQGLIRPPTADLPSDQASSGLVRPPGGWTSSELGPTSSLIDLIGFDQASRLVRPHRASSNLPASPASPTWSELLTDLVRSQGIVPADTAVQAARLGPEPPSDLSGPPGDSTSSGLIQASQAWFDLIGLRPDTQSQSGLPGLVGTHSDLVRSHRALSIDTGLVQATRQVRPPYGLVGPYQGLVRPPGLIRPPLGLVRPPEAWFGLLGFDQTPDPTSRRSELLGFGGPPRLG
ncbi:hypothetical protein FNV43_RR02253 [Rhamnella rubrinervis]|uniref:Uncharacterized protein n=1 Tax=Rhamnella rubrinervis TaxID=2594499 RepID=A0A8K0MTY1_9ROSA|nr:hypothetical protein FNV43_RR02253 [Rhamnella rubrinervis]